MRSYYSQDWHCDCKPESHSLDNYIKALHNIFDGDYESADVTYDDKNIHVNIKNNCVLMSKIFQVEFHGLVLSSIHSRSREEPFGSEISFMFDMPSNTLSNKGDVQK